MTPQAAFEKVFSGMTAVIDDLVASIAADHRPFGIVIEAGDRPARVQCVARADAVRYVESHAAIVEVQRPALVREVADAPANVMPVVLAISSRGAVFASVRRVARKLVDPGFRVSDREAFARFLLDAIHPKAEEPSDAWLDRAAAWADDNPAHPRRHALRCDTPARCAELGWTIAWALGGFQRIELGDLQAAALMCTDAGTDRAILSCAPWPAYTIEIPNGVVDVPLADGTHSFSIATVWHTPEGQTQVGVHSRTTNVDFLGPLQFPLPPLKLDAPTDDPISSTFRAAAERAVERFANLVIATEAKMTDPTQVRLPREPKRKGATKGSKPGGTRITRLSYAITVDFREAVAAYISGKRHLTPNMSTFVMGHFRRTYYGPKKAKMYWAQIDPVWRNPTAAKVAVRPHRIK